MLRENTKATLFALLPLSKISIIHFPYKSPVLSPSVSMPNLTNSVKIPLPHAFISLNHSLFLSQVYLFNLVSPNRDIFSPTCSPFLLACYFKVRKVILLFKLMETVPFFTHQNWINQNTVDRAFTLFIWLLDIYFEKWFLLLYRKVFLFFYFVLVSLIPNWIWL